MKRDTSMLSWISAQEEEGHFSDESDEDEEEKIPQQERDDYLDCSDAALDHQEIEQVEVATEQVFRPSEVILNKYVKKIQDMLEVKLYNISANHMEVAKREAHLWMEMTPPQLKDFTFDPNGILKFQLQNWLAGHEYAYMLRHYKAYLQCYPEKIEIAERSHPLSIYENPKAGQIYFIRGWHLREFGFPRDLDLVKRYKWKKMNFTTDLPKKNPLCTYLVAGAAIENTQLRMHVVCFAKEYSKKYRNPEVLKHLRFTKDKAKLLDEDVDANSGRILLCHITRVGTPPAAGCQLARSNGCRRKRLNVNKSRKSKKDKYAKSVKKAYIAFMY